MCEPDPELVAALAADLNAADCHAMKLPVLIGREAVAAMSRQVATPARRALAAVAEPAATLIAAFMLGDQVQASALAAALPTVGLDGARRLGLIEIDGDQVRTLVAIRPWLTRSQGKPVSWWVVSDHDELSSVIPLPDEHVLGVGGAGRTLASLLPTEPVASALDLGSGCGLIALHLAQVADRVVATDISSRALWCTALTCALNGVTTVETRQGSLLEPVAGEHFDLIASNPPFVITPRSGGEVPLFQYRDGGLEGDELMATLVRSIPDYLTAHGTAVMLGNWEERGDRVGAAVGSNAAEEVPSTGLDRVLGWVGENSCWVLEREQLSPAGYAEMWVRDGGLLPSSREGAVLVDAWLDDFERRGVTGIGLGWILLARGGHTQRAEKLAQPLDLAQLGPRLVTLFDAIRAVNELDDEALAGLHLVTAADVTDIRYFTPGHADPSVMELRQGGALARTVRASTGLTALVSALDGDYDVATLIAAIAGILDVDGEALAAELLPQVRELLIAGMVTVAH